MGTQWGGDLPPGGPGLTAQDVVWEQRGSWGEVPSLWTSGMNWLRSWEKQVCPPPLRITNSVNSGRTFFLFSRAISSKNSDGRPDSRWAFGAPGESPVTRESQEPPGLTSPWAVSHSFGFSFKCEPAAPLR